VLLLVHGGGWRRGNKKHGRLIGDKLAHIWLRWSRPLRV
jgi:arylformamidase